MLLHTTGAAGDSCRKGLMFSTAPSTNFRRSVSVKRTGSTSRSCRWTPSAPSRCSRIRREGCGYRPGGASAGRPSAPAEKRAARAIACDHASRVRPGRDRRGGRRILAAAVYQQHSGVRIIAHSLDHLAQAQVADAEEDRVAVGLSPAVHHPRALADQALRSRRISGEAGLSGAI